MSSIRTVWCSNRTARTWSWDTDRLMLCVLGLAALVPLIASAYDLFLYELIVLYAAAALGMFLTVQVSGEFMVGHVAIIGIAAFAVGWFNANLHWESLATLPVAVVAGAIAALILGLPGIRLNSLYLGVISFFAVLILPDLATAFTSVTGGEFGLVVGNFSVGGHSTPWAVFEVSLAVLAVSYLLIRNIVRSTYGARMMALRDAPESLQTCGVRASNTKLIVYLLSSVPASLAGWMLAQVNGIVLASFFGLSLSVILIAAVVVGGRRTVVGVVLACALLASYTNLVGQFSQYNQLGLGLILAAVIALVPSGIDSAAAIIARLKSLVKPQRLEAPRDRATPPEVPAEGCDLPAFRPLVVPASETVVLRVSSISKAFGGNRALEDVSFEMRVGRVVGLVGANGSGKTTLINVMSGFVEPDHGTVEVAGRDVTGRRPYAISRAGLSRTFQVPRLIDDLTVRRNLEVGMLNIAPDGLTRSILVGGAGGAARTQRAAAVDEIVDLLRLEPGLLNAEAGSLSLGMKRIVEIGRAMATGAQVLCLDEPAAGLNEPEILRLHGTLQDIVASGRAVLVVEHHMRFVMSLCQDILVLERGRAVAWWQNTGTGDLPEALRQHVGVTL
jgi:branched-chain amino acid transport system permease protein